MEIHLRTSKFERVYFFERGGMWNTAPLFALYMIACLVACPAALIALLPDIARRVQRVITRAGQ